MLKRMMLVLALAFLSSAAAPAHADKVGDQIQRLHTRIHELSPFERRFIVLSTWEAVGTNSKSLLNDTPQHYLWSLKVVAVEQRMLSRIATEAGWPEMADLLEENSARMVGMIQGKRKSRAAFEAEVADWSRRYDALMHQTQARWPIESKRPASPAFMALRGELKTYVAAGARITIGSESELAAGGN